MKVAIAVEGQGAGVSIVTEHFGHCEGFNLYEVENGEVKKLEQIKNPGHQPGFLPEFLGELDVNIVITGGMGGRAIELFNAKGIEVVTGAGGKVSEVIEDFAKGRLVTTESTCSH